MNLLNKNMNNNVEKNTNIITEILEWIFCIVIAITIALLFKYFIGTPTIVKMTSMYPTLKEKDRLLLNRTIRISHKIPKRGDIITFEAPSKKFYIDSEVDNSNPVAKYEKTPSNFISSFVYNVLEINKESYIKRVIAFSGEHVEIKDGKIFINGNILNEPYLSEDVTTTSDSFNNFTVPDGYIFAIGDNRTASMDCRNFGCIPINKIEGIVLFRFFPLNKFGKIF